LARLPTTVEHAPAAIPGSREPARVKRPSRTPCDDARVHRVRPRRLPLSALLCVLGLSAPALVPAPAPALVPALVLAPALATAPAPAPALAAASHAQLWTALGRQVNCGVAIHPPNTPPMQLLCSATPVPAPKAGGFCDPGFVFLGSGGRPSLARLSQDTFVGTSPVALASGSRWSIGPISVTCKVSASAVRCANRAHHGFTITKRSYSAF
jgi:hypothetical protein